MESEKAVGPGSTKGGVIIPAPPFPVWCWQVPPCVSLSSVALRDKGTVEGDRTGVRALGIGDSTDAFQSEKQKKTEVPL